LLGNNLKICNSINNVHDCKVLQCDIDCVQNWCIENGMILNVDKTTFFLSFPNKTVSINFNYKLCNNLILYFHCVKDLGVLLDCKLYSHHNIDDIFSQGLKLLGLICYITSSFSTPHSLCVLYTTLVQSKLEYASVPRTPVH
jgi:hypothetical protein